MTLEAEILDARPDYGYAVKWVNVPAETHSKLERVISHLLAQVPDGRVEGRPQSLNVKPAA